MQISLLKLGSALARTLVDSLKSDSARVKSLAIAEGRKLAIALSEIAGLLAREEIDMTEARLLVNVQRSASEAVLASLAEIARRDAVKAVKLALGQAIGLIDKSAGSALLRGLTSN